MKTRLILLITSLLLMAGSLKAADFVFRTVQGNYVYQCELEGIERVEIAFSAKGVVIKRGRRMGMSYRFPHPLKNGDINEGNALQFARYACGEIQREDLPF